MSTKELDRIGVMARVESGELKVVDAAGLLGVSYRQAKLWGSSMGMRGGGRTTR